MKLSVKASFLLSGLVLAVIAATSLFLLDYQRRALVAVIKQDLESEATTLAREIRTFVDENLNDTRAIAGNIPREALVSGDLNAIREHLARQAAFYPKFENGLFLLDSNGNFLTDYPYHAELHGQPFAHRDYFQRTKAREQGVIGDPYVSMRTGLPVLTFTAPVFSRTGQLLAVLGASVNLLSPSALGEQQQRKIGHTGYVYMVDRNRQFLMHPDKSKILRSLEAGRNLFLDRAVQGYEGVGETVNSSGVPVLIASRQLPALGWVALAQLPRKEALATMNEGLAAVGMFFFAALGVVLPVGFFAMRRIVKPLEALEHAALIISQDLRKAEGALTRPFASSALDALRTMRSSDEIGRLARAFFQLSVRLKQTLSSLRTSAEDWERTFSSVQEAVLVLDGEGRILRVNRVAEDLFRVVREDALGRPWREILAMGRGMPEDWPSLQALKGSGRFKLTTTLPGVPGRFELSFSMIQGRRESKGFLLMVLDVTEKIQAEERIRDLAFHDPLTRLPNRLLLADRLEQAIATADRNNSKVGVLFLDLDDFKKVNDTFGHKVGDELLKQVGKRLSSCLRSNDTLARYAGDEFVAVLMDLKDAAEAANIASRMLETVADPFDLSGKLARIGVSIGIAVYPEDGAEAALLLNHADTAMYRAKGRGKNSFWFADGVTVDDSLSTFPRQ
ncbi:MAG: diguanylate cyclase domain-containing protein [Acidobacteriota bacterium]